MQQRISIITLGVQNLERSRAFYEGLGWRVATEEDSENIVAFNLQSFTLCLYPRHKLSEDTTTPMQSSGLPTFTMAYNVHSKEEVHTVLEEAIQAGATLVKTPQEVFWGGYSGYFSDPDGYLWEIAWNPFTQPGKDAERVNLF